jgi:hypothetical protein
MSRFSTMHLITTKRQEHLLLQKATVPGKPGMMFIKHRLTWRLRNSWRGPSTRFGVEIYYHIISYISEFPFHVEFPLSFLRGWGQKTGLQVILIYSMVQDIIWKADCHSACQKYPAFLWNLKVRYRVHTSQPLDTILSQLNPFRPIDPISLRIILILSSHLLLGLPSGLLPSGLPIKIL